MIDRKLLNIATEDVHRQVRTIKPEEYAKILGFDSNDLGLFIKDFIHATRNLETDLEKFAELSKLFLVGFLVGRTGRARMSG